MTPAIVVDGLQKRYGDLAAVRGISFAVGQGEVFGLLGPNGAGKTTTVEILEGLRQRSGGTVSVLGYDPERSTNALKDRIGISLQATNLPDKIKVIEAIELFAAFYSRNVDVEMLLQRLQLTEKRHDLYANLSGGQKQRLAIALALVNDPQIVFLDEPTTGLDPQVRLEIHSLIEQLRRERKTILLTTHYIEEAERLCDRVAIVDEGQVIAIGTPLELQQRTMGKSRCEIEATAEITSLPTAEVVGADSVSLSEDRRRITATTGHPARTVAALIKWIEAQGLELSDISLKKPTLEDVFIELTGKRLRD